MKASRKNARKLKKRQDDWDALREDQVMWGGTVKIVRGIAFRKPGSQKR